MVVVVWVPPAKWLGHFGSCLLLLLICTSEAIYTTPRVCEYLCNPLPAVSIADGCVCGIERPTGFAAGGLSYDAFYGIPFAKPPVDQLRFANPVPIGVYKDIHNGSFPRGICIQKNDFSPNAQIQGDEDCLHLNVYRPKNMNGTLPVMVYIHGGGFIGGSAHPSYLGPEKFMSTEKVILVTPQYRLGVFGFLSTRDREAPGNFGLKDQVLALQWVQQNIGAFGGDPTQVTIFGSSSGASSVQFHMMSPSSEGLFSKAMMLSGSALAFWNEPSEDSEFLAQDQVYVLGVGGREEMTSKQIIEILRLVDAEDLLASIDKLKVWHTQPSILYTPVVEKYAGGGAFLVEDPKKIWREGRYQKVPWMMGYVPNEGSIASVRILNDPALLDELIQLQRRYLPLFSNTTRKHAMDLYERFFQGNRMNVDNSDGFGKVTYKKKKTYSIQK
ncbi:juvenile hormone esterase-like [Uranotaenia lowii]|uniref:juvenile hormone esterase-like n=1 Tax=Uranotaenia lowii TaxID=190385 RepID=UPI002478D43C|nr:juvenile hormone esterase-like [Uranotaenia lowii]